jgi:elongation factor P
MDIEDVRKNVKLMIEGKPFNIDDVDFVKPGKGRAIYRLKLRNLRDGNTLERTYHSSEKVEEVSIGVQEEQYLYKEGDNFVFMNTQTFEQKMIPEHMIGDRAAFLKEGTTVTMTMMGDEPIEITMPTFVELQIIGSELTTKTATITPQNKAARVETGYTIGVPAFIKEGDIIKIDTRTGAYVERITGKK